MTLDTSAVIAILFAEPGHLDLVDRILDAEAVRIGAPTLAETGIVFASRTQRQTLQPVSTLMAELDVTIVPFTEAHAAAAVRADQRFGRGRHKAGLNFGDCLSYAVAALARDTLLFVGRDFALTDVEPG